MARTQNAGDEESRSNPQRVLIVIVLTSVKNPQDKTTYKAKADEIQVEAIRRDGTREVKKNKTDNRERDCQTKIGSKVTRNRKEQR